MDARAREVVELAARRARKEKLGALASWLFLDERGTWEREAAAQLAKPRHQVMADDEAADVIADRLVFLAAAAVRKSATGAR